MSRLTMMLFALCAAAFLSGCEGPDKYPISGEDCGPDDPVKELDASIADCAPAA